MNTHRIIRCAVFSAVALIIFVLESLIPPVVPIPGFKLGLANTVTLASMYILGIKDAFWILLVRILLGNLFTGQIMSMVYSLCGGMLCFGITAALKDFFGKSTLWALGIIGAVFHNIGQVACACVLFGSTVFVYYGLVLCFASFFTGTFTGLAAQFTVNYFHALRSKNHD